MTELMEQRPRVFKGEQHRFAFARLGEIHDVDDDGADVAAEPFLLAQASHPGAAMLGAAGKIIAEKEPALPALRIPNLPDPHILVPDGNVFALLEAQAEQPVRGVERRLYDPLELEIRLDRRLIHIAAQLAQLLGIIAPVPGGELEVLSLR